MRSNGAYRAALRGARLAASAAPQLMPRLTATVRENLRLAFGRTDEAIVRGVYRHFALAAVDVWFFRRLFDPARREEHFRFEGDGFEHYRRHAPGGAVIATGHFGNWELYGAALAHAGIPVAPVVQPPRSPRVARWIERFRRDVGEEIIPKKNALPLAMKAIRRGACVAFLMDQAAGRHGIEVPFFGHPARTYTTPAALAKKLDVPLYAGRSVRLGDGISYRCLAEVVPTDGDVETVTRRLNGILEGYVRAQPDQWWWFHKRFKPPRLARVGARLTPAGIPEA